MARIWCWLVGHQYEVWQHFGPGSRRVICHHCRGDWGMHDGTQAFVPWNGDFDKLYQVMGYRIRPVPAFKPSEGNQ